MSVSASTALSVSMSLSLVRCVSSMSCTATACSALPTSTRCSIVSVEGACRRRCLQKLRTNTDERADCNPLMHIVASVEQERGGSLEQLEQFVRDLPVVSAFVLFAIVQAFA